VPLKMMRNPSKNLITFSSEVRRHLRNFAGGLLTILCELGAKGRFLGEEC